ncbi:G3E family GTPase [Bradyrhizobium sp. LB7.2]
MVSLANGCICCSLQGDLLRTLSTLLRRDPKPEYIVIETSGVADPADIVRNLMDPVILREAPLETVLCVMDAATPLAALDDALQRSQLRVADIVALSKLDLADEGAGGRMREAIRAQRVPAVVVDAPHGEIPSALLFPATVDRASAPRDPGPRRPAEERFETLSWTSDQPLSLPRVQKAIGKLAPKLARAKGLFETVEQPGRQMLFQFAAGRATLVPGDAALAPGDAALAPCDAPAEDVPRARIVFIAELGVLSKAELDGIMETCVADR